jgi:outer membrane receptor protein involved in Fe transport
MTLTFRRSPLALALSALASIAAAQTAPVVTAALQLEPVTVQGNYFNSVGSSDAASQGVVTAKLIESRPTLRPAEVLEFVPGVIVSQHSGDGKANQYFLRGFNLDHGADFASFVAGMPVNMPTARTREPHRRQEGPVLRRRGRLRLGRRGAHRPVRPSARKASRR